jgi:dolichol kinase
MTWFVASTAVLDKEGLCITGARSCRDEYPRQFAHFLLGLGAAVLILVLSPGLPARILAGALIVGFLLSTTLRTGLDRASLPARFAGVFVRVRETPYGGALSTGLSILAALLLFPASSVAAASIAFGVLDSVSTIFGLRYGRHRLQNGKSLEGMLSGAVCAIPVLFPFLSPAGAVLVAFGAALAELVLPVEDNLVVPFLLALLVTGLS